MPNNNASKPNRIIKISVAAGVKLEHSFFFLKSNKIYILFD
jgi:hypothetical protein